MDRSIYFKELAHAIVKAGEFKVVGQPSRLETQGRTDFAAGV